MLYSLLFSTLVLALTCPILACLGFIKGYNLSARKHGEETLKVLPEAHGEEPKGDTKLMSLMANINAYDGTEKGQRPIDG
jgi:hypothetical protein